MENLNKEPSDEKKYNEMMKPITYTSEYDKKYKYRHDDLIWRSKYRAMKGRLKSLKRLHLLYEQEENGKQEKLFQNSDKTANEIKYTTPRDIQSRLVEDVGLYSVFSDDTSTKGPSIKLARDTKRLFRKIPEVRTTTDGVLRDHPKDRVKMWNINLRNDDRFSHYNQARSQSSVKKRRAIQFKSDKGTQSTLKINREVQNIQPVTRNDSLDLTEARERSKEFEDVEERKNTPKLVLKAGVEKVYVSEIDFLDGFDRLGEHDCRKMLNEIYFKPDEDIISSIYVLKSDIPSVQLMNIITVRIPVKIRFDSEKLLFSVRIKVGLVWRRLDANFEDTAGNSMCEGYIVFRTEHRGNFFAACDFIQFTYKVDKRGYKFKNALIPDIQVAVKSGAVEEPEDITFQVRLLDRKRYSKYEDLSPRFIYPVIYATDGLWIRRNKSLYSRMVAPLLISISNDTSYGTDNEVYLIREKQGHIHIIGERSSIDKKFIVLLDNKHTTFWYVVTKEINKYKSYEHLLERGFSVATAKTCVCKILTFHENRKEEFLIWVCIVEHPDVDDTISKFLGLNGVSGNRRLEMARNGGVSRNIDFAARSFDVSIELDVNFKQRYYKELPTLTFKVGHTCRVQFKAICRIKPLLCDDIEKYGVIRYIIGSENIHEVPIDTASDFEEMLRPVVPEYSKEAIEKLLSAESLHSIAYCVSEDEVFDLASRLGISALTVTKILIMYGSVESKNFRLFLLWKKGIKGEVSDIKDFINAFYDIERGDIALGITDALEKCQHFKK